MQKRFVICVVRLCFFNCLPVLLLLLLLLCMLLPPITDYYDPYLPVGLPETLKLLRAVCRRKFGVSREAFKLTLGSCETIAGWHAWSLMPLLEAACMRRERDTMNFDFLLSTVPCPCPRGHPTVCRHDRSMNELLRKSQPPSICFPASRENECRSFMEEEEAEGGGGDQATTTTATCRTCGSAENTPVKVIDHHGSPPSPPPHGGGDANEDTTVKLEFCCLHCCLYECGRCVRKRLSEFRDQYLQRLAESKQQQFPLQDFEPLDSSHLPPMPEPRTQGQAYIEHIRRSRVGTFDPVRARPLLSAQRADKKNFVRLLLRCVAHGFVCVCVWRDGLDEPHDRINGQM